VTIKVPVQILWTNSLTSYYCSEMAGWFVMA